MVVRAAIWAAVVTVVEAMDSAASVVAAMAAAESAA